MVYEAFGANVPDASTNNIKVYINAETIFLQNITNLQNKNLGSTYSFNTLTTNGMTELNNSYISYLNSATFFVLYNNVGYRDVRLYNVLDDGKLDLFMIVFQMIILEFQIQNIQTHT